MPEFNDGFVKTGQYIFLRGKWTEEVENKLLKVVFTQMIPYIVPVNVNAGEYVDVGFMDKGLYPTSMETVYEIGIGIKGDALIYPMIPSNVFYNKLEKSGFVPSEDLSVDKYIGGFDERIADLRFRLKEYTIKNYQDITYRVYGDSYRDTKCVIYFMVNRLHVKIPTTDETEKIMSNLAENVAKGVVRVVNSYLEARW